MTSADRLAELGIELPDAPSPAAAYRPWMVAGTTIRTAGQLPVVDGVLPVTGRLGEDIDTDQGRELARTAGLNLLAVLRDASGDLDVVDVLKITVYVASAPGFVEQHLVADGVSTLLVDVLGDRGRHARSAVGVASLPLGSPVEIDAVANLATVE